MLSFSIIKFMVRLDIIFGKSKINVLYPVHTGNVTTAFIMVGCEKYFHIFDPAIIGEDRPVLFQRFDVFKIFFLKRYLTTAYYRPQNILKALRERGKKAQHR